MTLCRASERQRIGPSSSTGSGGIGPAGWPMEAMVPKRRTQARVFLSVVPPMPSMAKSASFPSVRRAVSAAKSASRPMMTWSAPWPRAAFASLLTVPMMVQPRDFAQRVRAMPRPPAAAWTRMVVPCRAG